MSLRTIGWASVLLGVMAACGPDRPSLPSQADVTTFDVDAAVTPDVPGDDALGDAVVAPPDAPERPDVRPDPPDVGAVPDGRACASAVPITPGVTLRGQSTEGATRVAPPCASGGSAGSGNPVVFYTVTVPAGQLLTVSAPADFGAGSSTPPTLRLFSGCDLSSCLAGGTHASSTEGTVLRHANTGASPQTYVLAVGSPSSLAPSRFTLTATTGPIPVSESCLRAAALTDGVTVRNESTAAADTVVPGCTATGTTNPAVFYSVTVPAGNALTVTSTRESGTTTHYAPLLRLFPGCASSACLAASMLSPFSDMQNVRYFNDTGAAQSLVVVVSSVTAQAARYSLVARLQPSTSGISCAAPTALSEGTTLRGETTEFALATGPTCDLVSTGRATFYSTSVPANQTLTVVTNPEGAYNVQLRLLADCAASTCLATVSSRSTSVPTVLRYANATGAPRRVLIAASSASISDVGRYNITATLRPTLPNAQCAGATALSEGVPLREENVFAGADPLPSCVGLISTEPTVALYYRVTVPAGRAVTLTATAADSLGAPYLAVLPACGATTCLAVARPASAMTAATTTRYVNPAATPVTVIVAAGYHRLTRPAVFTLSAALEPSP